MTSPLENRNADRAAPRIRGRKLQAIRRAHFDRNPLCVECQKHGLFVAATQLDHIVPLFKGGKDDDTNRQGLCESCHDKKTHDDLGWTQRQATGLDGWPA